MTVNGIMVVTLRYFTEFGKPSVLTHNRVDLWRNLCTSLLYFVLRVRCRRKENSRSLSHPLMSFLFIILYLRKVLGILTSREPSLAVTMGAVVEAGRFPPLPVQQYIIIIII